MLVLLSLAVGLALIGLYAAGYTAVAWHLARRTGRHWLLGAWVAGALLFWLVSLIRLRILDAAISIPPQTSADRLAVFGFLAWGVLGVGLATLSVWRRIGRNPEGQLTLGGTMAGVGAFFAGMLLVLLAVLISDIFREGPS
jgi:hypothetical protein